MNKCRYYVYIMPMSKYYWNTIDIFKCTIFVFHLLNDMEFDLLPKFGFGLMVDPKACGATFVKRKRDLFW